MKRNPRPRKYESAAARQAAYKARADVLEFRAEPKTAASLTSIAKELDVSRSELLLSMVKFALTNHDWARFGLTHKTLPYYQGNPIMAKTFQMSMPGQKVDTPYLFSFTHYIPQNSYGGSKVAFKFYAHEDGSMLVVSEGESGKRIGIVDVLDRAKYGDKTAAKKVIENLLMRHGADKVYTVLNKG